MRSAIVIPARYGSSRLPGKPLLKHTGKYLIQHVYEQATRARLATDVIIATDDPRIEAAAGNFGGRVVMTRRDHATGTDRIAEVARNLNADVIVNLQGDEPLIDPGALDRLIHLLATDPGAGVATLATPIDSAERYSDPNVVKVVCDRNGRALYFSRSPIPAYRDGSPSFTGEPAALQHLGVYAYRRSVLLELAGLDPSPAELAEKLEQLRVLHQGWAIRVGVVAGSHPGVDTWDDYLRFVSEYRAGQVTRAVAA